MRKAAAGCESSGSKEACVSGVGGAHEEVGVAFRREKWGRRMWYDLPESQSEDM